MTQPRVSVIIPCYNHGRYVGEAIESVLAQTWTNIEVMVIDDGSDDDTAAVASRYPSVRYVRQRNQGLGAARNTGARETTGDYLVFLDATGGYDAGVDETADYGFNLKITRLFSIASHESLVAETRYREGSMSRNFPAMLESVLRVMDNEKGHVTGDAARARMAHRRP